MGFAYLKALLFILLSLQSLLAAAKQGKWTVEDRDCLDLSGYWQLNSCDVNGRDTDYITFHFQSRNQQQSTSSFSLSTSDVSAIHDRVLYIEQDKCNEIKFIEKRVSSVDGHEFLVSQSLRNRGGKVYSDQIFPLKSTNVSLDANKIKFDTYVHKKAGWGSEMASRFG